MRKHPKMKYTDMCIYIDENVYKENFDEAKIFNYIQMIIYALAVKQRFFNNEKDYDDFSLYLATNVYCRLTNKKQFLPDDDPKKMDKVKSVLNYIKKVLDPGRINYQNDTFRKSYSADYEGLDVSNGIYESLAEGIRSQQYELVRFEVEDYFKAICGIVKESISDIPYRNDKLMMNRIYKSVLLTLLRAFTLSNHNYKTIFYKNTGQLKTNVDSMLIRMYEEERVSSPIVWHLDESMKPYIAVLANKVKKDMAKEVRSIIRYYEPSDDIIMDILMQPLSEMNDNID